MAISVVGSDFDGYGGSPLTADVPFGAQSGDVLVAIISRTSGTDLVEDLSAWTHRITLETTNVVSPGTAAMLDIYTKPWVDETDVAIEFGSSGSFNAVTLILARTVGGDVSVLWLDSLQEHSGDGGTIEDSHHRFPFRSEAVTSAALVVKTSLCRFAQSSVSTPFNTAVTGDNLHWADFEGNEQHTPLDIDDNRLFVATELLATGEVMLDSSGIGDAVANNAHANHTTGNHDGASITLVLVDEADTGPTTDQELFNASYADASAADPKVTALIRPADVQRSIDTDVSNLAGGPNLYTVEAIFDIGELSDLNPYNPTTEKPRVFFVKDDQPGLRQGKNLLLKSYTIRDADPSVPVTCTFWG